MLHTRLKSTLTLLFLTLTLTAPLPWGSATPATAATLAQSSPDFSIVINPTSRHVKRGSGTLYDIDVTALDGFNGTVTFTITGLPPNTSATSPQPVTGSGVSTFTVQTHKIITPTGTFTLTITGTSGSLTHTAQATLSIG